MFVLRWLGRILRPFSILKRYLLTLTWILFIAILYVALQVPVKIDCQVKCTDDGCTRLRNSGCQQTKAQPMEEIDSQPPRHRRTKQNFIEYLLSHSENGDREDSALLFTTEDREQQEDAPLIHPFEILNQLRRIRATAQPDSQTTVVTKRSRLGNSSHNEGHHSTSLNNHTSTVSIKTGTGTMLLDNVTGNVWINNGASSERINSGILRNNATDAISLTVESGKTPRNVSTGTAPLRNSTGTKSLINSTGTAPLSNSTATTSQNIGKRSTSLKTGTGTISPNISRSTPLRSSAIESSPEKRVENQTDLVQTAPRKPVLNGSEAENTDSRQNDSSRAQGEDKLDPDPVEKYFEDERKKCAKQDLAAHANASEYSIGEDDHLHDNVNSSKKFCPCIPPNLVGRVAVNLSSVVSLDDLWASEHRDIESGGEWQPSDCRSRTRLALIVPYRDRLDHLKIFLRHLLPILKRQLTHFRIFIVEQNVPAVFNKAAMMNIGYLEALKQFQFDCVMFHDVDVLMEDDRSLLNCGDIPHHYAISLDRWNYHLKYQMIFGAVISLRPEMFNRTNGFSNSFFGWGGEDDDMGQRVRRFWEVYRPPMELGRYTAVKHDRDAANAVNKERVKILRSQKSRFSRDGINSIRYKVEKIQKRPLFTWILANLDASRLPYPSHVSFRYNLSQGVCNDAEAMTAPRQLSQVTCQYDCDRQRESCIGYNHRIDGDSRECWLLTRNCTSFSDLTHQQSSSQTYLKKMMPVLSSGMKKTKTTHTNHRMN